MRAITRFLAAAGVVLGAAVLAGLAPEVRAEERAFPDPHPATRAEAVDLLCPASDSSGICVRRHLGQFAGTPAAARSRASRPLEVLGRGIRGVVEEWAGPQDTPIRYTTDARSDDRIDTTDGDGNGLPDVVDAVADALLRARDLITGQLELPGPALREVVLVELGDRVGGYVLPATGHGGRATLVLEATPRGGVQAVQRSAVRQYAYAAALQFGIAFPPEWAEAFAAWTETYLEGLDDDGAALLSQRLRDLGRGIFARRAELDAGNSIWFAFLEQAYGLAAVRITVEELAGPLAPTAALDRAVRRTASLDLPAAFREFHLWALLTGRRADGFHFAFAGDLEFPGFAATTAGLPALSVHREPPVAPFGAAQVRLVPQAAAGGMRVRFEGDFAARWDADLLLIGHGGWMHRLPLPVSPEGRGELTVPLDGVGEVLILVRHVESDDGAPRRYTYSAHHDSSYPFRLSSLAAVRAEDGILVAWDTAFEQDLVGYNILRRRIDAEEEVTVNPVWVPALGGLGEGTSYHFLDPTARSEDEYVYRIQGITYSGLSSYSESVLAATHHDER